jgi:hypothetical protein
MNMHGIYTHNTFRSFSWIFFCSKDTTSLFFDWDLQEIDSRGSRLFMDNGVLLTVDQDLRI